MERSCLKRVTQLMGKKGLAGRQERGREEAQARRSTELGRWVLLEDGLQRLGSPHPAPRHRPS